MTNPARDRLLSFLLALALSLGAGVGCSESAPAPQERAQAAAHDELWTCGMHPHVLEHGPGTCPICGMDLTRVKSVAPGSAGGAEAKGERQIKQWVAPMDPGFVSDRPGKSPMGMDLVPVYETVDDGAAPGSVRIEPGVMQNMGVRSQRVVRQPLFRHVRTLGEVVVGEDRVSVVNLRFSGWVEQILADKTGAPVAEGDPLFAVYSPDLVAAQEEYLLALRTQGPKSGLARSARRKLELFDLDSDDLAALAKQGRATRTMLIRAPRSGYILRKDVVEGARVSAGQDLYTIADLSRVWVQAEVYEFDAPWVEEGQPAQMELAYERGRSVPGRVAYVYPTLNPVSRTLTVRLEFPNPDLRLKPGMFATVYIQFRREDNVLVVPSEAILHSGKRELVFVAVGEGRFEPREIATGLVGDRHLTQVLSGLEEGEVVVTSGQFLIDSESQLQEAMEKMLVRRSGPAPSAVSEPPAVYACPMHPEEIAHEPGRCGICGMDLERRLPDGDPAAETSR